jgi:beta-lactamase superfamily II metal-dependent hydrolase/fibronectin type 3 domain-containing protein/DNA/RNA endonuclease YhcR with UshA esterase domain
MVRRVLSFAAILIVAATLQAAPFTAGNIVVYRVGDGAIALSANAAPVFLDEYTPAGVLVQSVAMPTAVAGANLRLTASGSATTEGFLSRSQDGAILAVPGYDANTGTVGITTSTTVPRVMGRVDSSGAIDTSSSYIDAASSGNIRSVASIDGTRYWASGSTQGVRTVAHGGSGAATIVSSTATNLRQIGIFSGQLYIGSGAGTIRMGTVGSGTPITSGNVMTSLPGFPTAAPTAVNGYLFADLDAGVAGVDTLYVADEGNAVIAKWCLVAGTWTARGTVAQATARGLTGSVSGSTVTLFATSGGAGTPIVTISDASGYNANLTGSVTTIVATAGTNRAFRALAMAPVSATPAPTVTSIVRTGVTPTNASTLGFTVTFSEPVTGVDITDFALAVTGSFSVAPGIVSVSGTGPYTVTVNSGTGTGTVGLNLVDDDSIINGTSTPLGGPGAGNGNFTGEIYAVDTQQPTVTSAVRAGANPTNAASVNFTVTFSENVSGVDITDFSAVAGGGVTGASVTGVSGGPQIYTVAVNSGSGSGTVQLDVLADSTIVDSLGNPMTTPFSGQAYTLDKTAPSVQSSVRAGTDPTSAQSVGFTVTFSENVSGVNSGDFEFTYTGSVAGASVTGVSGGPSVYTVTVDTGTGSGTLRLDVADDDSISDTVGNPLGGPGDNGDFTSGEVYTMDKSTPTVVSVTRAAADPTNALSLPFTVTFNGGVTGVDASDFAVVVSGTITGQSVSNVSGTGSTRTVTVTFTSGDGSVRLDVVDDDTIINGTSTPLGGAGAGNGNHTGDEVYTVDRTAPSVQSVTRTGSSSTNAASVTFNVVFSESVSGVDTTDFAITSTGTIAGASVSGVTGGPVAYVVNVSTGTGDGDIRLDVADDDTIVDTATNSLSAAFTTGESYTLDRTAPAVQSIVRADPNPTSAASVNYTVTFSESISGVGISDFTLTTTGAISGTSVTNVAGGPMVYTVTVSTGSDSGTIRLNVTDDDSIVDAVTNPLGGAGAGNGNFTTGEVYTVNAPPAAPTGLVAVARNGGVASSWNVVGSATSYNLKRATVSGGPYSSIATPTGTTHDDTLVTNGTRYYYVVSAIGTSGESANSAEVHAKPDVEAAWGLTISQVYGAGGNAGATFTNDFIEIFNRGSSTVDVTGFSVQYASAAGTSWTPTVLSGTLAPGRHYLVQEGAGAGGTTPLPTPNATGGIAMSGTAGKVALVASSSALSGGCPSGATILDLAGYGSTASCFEGTGPTPNPNSNVNSLHRAANGCTDTNNNNTDFSNALANPRNTSAAATPCAFTAIGSASPVSVASGGTVLLRVELPPATIGGSVTGNLTSIGGSAAQAFFDDGTNGDVTLGDNVFSYAATASGSAGARVVPVSASNAASQTASTSISFFVTAALESIAAVKVDTTPADTVPDRNGQAVLVRGVVTSIDFRGGTGIEYYIQDPTGGIDIFSTSDFGPFTVGTNVEVSGSITQFNGLTEISPTAVTMLPGGTLPAVTPQTVTLSQLLDGTGEPLEGRLVRIDELTVTSGSFPASGASGNVTITDSTGSGTLRVDSDTDIDGTTAPGGIFSLIGLVSQSDASNPFDCCYQVLPRSTADIIPRTPPGGTGAANPPSVPPGATTLLTVTVTLGQNPPSTGISVIANLNAIGLSSSQMFFDDGSNGDVAPGDLVYSYSATVDSGTSLGPKSLPVLISDAQGRSSSASIALNIQSANAPPVPTNLVATPGNAQVALSWNASLGSTGYNVKRSLVSGGPYSTIAPNIAPTNYTDTSVTNGVHYYYVVSALSGAFESGDSSQADATPSAPPPSGPLGRIYFVDIGQGAGTLIVSPTGKSLLIDGGPPGQGNAKVIPLLNTLGIATVDYTIVTHYHVDHDAGITEVINANRVAGTAYDVGDAPNVVPPVPSNTTGAAYTAYKNAIAAHSGTVTRQTITPGLTINLGGGMQATCLVTAGQLASGGSVYISQSDLNSESISTLIEFNNFDYLVSGDLTGGGQTTTAKTPDVETFVAQMAGDVDAVQLDHHGSTTANNRRFLGTLKAEVSFASVGATNTFGHPNRETANKYLNIPVTSGNTYGGEGVPDPGNGPVFYQTDPSPATDNRCSVQGHSGADQAHAGQGTLLLETDGLISFTLKSFDDGGVRVSPSQHVYALDGQGIGLTTNLPPTVVPIISPAVPLSSDTVTVTALVNDREDAITSVTLNYTLNGAAQAPVTMTLGSGEFTATIPAQPNATRVSYTVTAIAGAHSTSYTSGYFAGTTPIANLRALTPLGEPLYLDYTARIAGLVTSGTGNYSSSNNDDYIEDASGALNLARTIEPATPATQPTTAGNTYTVTGLIGQLTGRLRLDVTPPFDGITKPWDTVAGSFNPYLITLTGSGTVTPLTRTIAQINADGEGHEAHLVQIANVTVVSGTIPSSGGVDGFLTINDGTGTMEMKIDGDGDIPGLATPSGPTTIKGIIHQDDFLRPFSTRYTLAPRDRTDLGAPAGGPALITIAEARADVDPSTGTSPHNFVPDRLGQQVKIRGVVSSVDFRGAVGTEIYIQDPTGGVDIFSTSINTLFTIGDNLEVIGTVAQFNGLTEITPGAVSDITILSPGTLPPVSMEVVTLSQLANGGVGEAYEGKLIRVNNVTLASPPATFAPNTNYNITDITGTVQMRIDSDTDIDGTAPPSNPFSVIGVLGQFDNASPFDSGYQLFPRIRASDFVGPTAAPASITATAGTPQTTTTGTAFATLLQATVKDAGNTPIEGIGVTFTAPSAGASASFANGTNTTSSATNASGVATATTLTANSTPGTYNVVASTASLTANFSLTNVNNSATHYSVTAPASVTAGVPFNVTVTARDASNAVSTGYLGTVHFTSSSSGTLPADYTFTGGDSGSHTFSVTLHDTGSQTITATDMATASITGSANVTVGCAPPPPVAATINAAAQVCAFSSGNTATASAAGATHYQWSIVNGSINAGQGTSSIQYTAGGSGQVQLTVAVTNAAGCSVASDGHATVNIRALPTATLPSTIHACTGSNATVSATLTGTGPFTVHWSDAVVQSVAASPATRTFVVNASQTRSITSLSDAFCTNNSPGASVNLIADTFPVITDHTKNAKINDGQTATLTVTTSTAHVTFAWYEGNAGNTSTPVGTNSATFTTPPLHHTTHYWVRISTACGHDDSKKITVTVKGN